MVPGISEKTGSTTSFIHSDRMGSMKVLSASATVSDTADYDAFGKVISRTGSSATQKGFASGHGYQEDGESGYKLLGHRYYDADSGRFLSRDPAFAGRNWYGYCENNPLKYVDANGQMAQTVVVAASNPLWIPVGLLAAGAALLFKGFVDVAPSIREAIDQIGRKYQQRTQPVPIGPDAATSDSDEVRDPELVVWRIGGPLGLYWSLEDPRDNPDYMQDYGLHTPGLPVNVVISRGKMKGSDAAKFSRSAQHYDGTPIGNKHELFLVDQSFVARYIRNRIVVDQYPSKYWKTNDETKYGAHNIKSGLMYGSRG